MSDARRQLQNAKKLVRLRLVEQSRAALKTAQARDQVRRSIAALAEAEKAIEAGDTVFTTESGGWGSITRFEAALAQRSAQSHDLRGRAQEVEDDQRAHATAIEDLRVHDARLGAAEQLVLIHRRRLRKTLERLEQSITDDLSVLTKSRDS